ncbi:hypothetical protein BCR33DRAFT_771198, partial [Rhizoclosmatium globosum]
MERKPSIRSLKKRAEKGGVKIETIQMLDGLLDQLGSEFDPSIKAKQEEIKPERTNDEDEADDVAVSVEALAVSPLPPTQTTLEDALDDDPVRTAELSKLVTSPSIPPPGSWQDRYFILTKSSILHEFENAIASSQNRSLQSFKVEGCLAQYDHDWDSWVLRIHGAGYSTTLKCEYTPDELREWAVTQLTQSQQPTHQPLQPKRLSRPPALSPQNIPTPQPRRPSNESDRTFNTDYSNSPISPTDSPLSPASPSYTPRRPPPTHDGSRSNSDASLQKQHALQAAWQAKRSPSDASFIPSPTPRGTTPVADSLRQYANSPSSRGAFVPDYSNEGRRVVGSANGRYDDTGMGPRQLSDRGRQNGGNGTSSANGRSPSNQSQDRNGVSMRRMGSRDGDGGGGGGVQLKRQPSDVSMRRQGSDGGVRRQPSDLNMRRQGSERSQLNQVSNVPGSGQRRK